MSAKQAPALLSILVIALLSVGCSFSKLETPSPISPTQTAEIPTATIPSTKSTPTILTTNTLTPILTLSFPDALASLRGLLNGSSACHLPCWMEITPGRSSRSDVDKQLAMFSSITSDSHQGFHNGDWVLDDMTIHDPSADNNMVIEIRSSYLTPSGGNVISVLGIETRSYSLKNGQYNGEVYGYPAYDDLLESYTISRVLSNFGLPQYIYVTASLRGDTTITPGVGDYFEIHLFYPTLGVFMRYRMSIEGSSGNYRFCPTNASISGYLISPELSANYQNVLIQLDDRYRNWFPPSAYVKTPQEAFGMTNEEIYELFRSQTDRCLETPISGWHQK